MTRPTSLSRSFYDGSQCTFEALLLEDEKGELPTWEAPEESTTGLAMLPADVEPGLGHGPVVPSRPGADVGANISLIGSGLKTVQVHKHVPGGSCSDRPDRLSDPDIAEVILGSGT